MPPKNAFLRIKSYMNSLKTSPHIKTSVMVQLAFKFRGFKTKQKERKKIVAILVFYEKKNAIAVYKPVRRNFHVCSPWQFQD